MQWLGRADGACRDVEDAAVPRQRDRSHRAGILLQLGGRRRFGIAAGEADERDLVAAAEET